MADNNVELVQQAIARNLGAVLSLPSAGMLRHCKSRFLGDMEGGVLLEAPGAEWPLIAELVVRGTPCGVSFRNGIYKVMFASPVLKAMPSWNMNASTTVDAILLKQPTQIKSLQRRANYRVEILPDCGISLRVWRIGDRAILKDQPASTAEIKAELRDLSIGGAGVRFPGKEGVSPRVSVDDRLRVQICQNEQILIIEGRMRAPFTTAPDGTIITGVHFKKLEKDLEGRQILAQLTRIVGELQREEVRRVRLGLAKAG